MEPSSKAFAIARHFEGLRLSAYQDQGGVWTIGYGHTLGVHAGMSITEDQAESFLESDIRSAGSSVNRLVNVKLNQDQFDALCDFVFNLGAGDFRGSTLLRLVNSCDFAGAASQFARWNHVSGKVSAGLTARREAERKLFEGEA